MPGRAHRSDVEGLRGVAVALVVAFHAGLPWAGGGYVGVDVFYVISGFVITRSLYDEARATGRISLAAFYARRIRRLLPLAALVLVAIAVGMQVFTPPVLRPAIRFDAIAAALDYANWQFAFESLNYLTLDTAQNPVLHYWSLSVEEQFYIVWPLLVLAAVSVGRRPARRLRARIAAVAGAVLVVSLAYSVVVTPAMPAIAYLATTTRAWELAVGALLAVGTAAIPRLPARAVAMLACGGMIAVLVASSAYGSTTPYPGTAALLPVLGAALVIACGSLEPAGGVARLLSLRPLRFVGARSYAWYLWHWPCLVFAQTASFAPAGRALWLARAAAVAVSFGLAVVSHAAVERPARRARWLATTPRRAVGLAGVATGAALVALTTLGPIQLPGGAVALASATPANAPMTPLAAAASTPYAAMHGCHVGYGATAPATGCVFGDRAARRTVVLVGDSHAAQWFPAFAALATRQRFRLVAWTKSGCPLTLGVHLYLPALGRDYAECLRWQQRVVALLRDGPRPALVVVARTSTYLPQVLGPDGDGVGTAEARRLWGRGVAATYAALRRLATRVLILRDTPRPPSDLPACISWDPDAAARCDFPRGPETDAAEYAVERAAGVPAAAYVDTAAVVCPQRECRAVVRGVIPFRDDNHLTARYSAARWRAFAAALERALGRPRV